MSNKVFEMPFALSERIAGRLPASAPQWLPTKLDVLNSLQISLADWINCVSHNEALFKVNVYENENLAETDIRQHRSWVCRLIADGELIAVGYIGYGKEIGNEQEVQPSIDLIEQKIKKLFEALIAWHAPLALQSDIPKSFKQAAREVDEGKIEDMDI